MEYNFLIAESLVKLKEKNYGIYINKTIDILTNNLNEEQLIILSKNKGLKIDSDKINLFFQENIGFRCYNDNDHIYGKLPICKNIESYMNTLYMDSFKNQTHS